jgi:ribosomal protein S18 acetylase RimI-like enzyme
MIAREITLRDAAPEDTGFLARLYCDVRSQETGAWGWPPEQQEIFLRMQFDAQCRSYRAGFPDAIDRIICLDTAAIGRILIAQKATTTHLIDIALLGVYRNRGIGTMQLHQLLQACERQSSVLRLQVLQGNQAIRLYQRLGFVQVSADPMYVQMEWTAPSRC